MTHPPELTALLETNPALWLAYVSRAKYEEKIIVSAFKGDFLAVDHYDDCLARTEEQIHKMGYSLTKIGKLR